MKKHLSRAVKRYRRSVHILHFYTKGFKRNILALLVFSMLLGLMETSQIVLLYSILNASFDLPDAGILLFEPLYNLVRNIIDLPDIVAFCLLFILVVFLTFLVAIIQRTISLQFTKAVIVKTKCSIFDKLRESDYRYFVDNKQGDILYNVVSSPDKIRAFLDASTRLFSDIIIIIIIVGTLFFVSPSGVSILLIGGLLFIVIVRVVGNRISYFIGKAHVQTVSYENKIINEYVHGLRQIRSVNADGYWRKQYITALSNYWDIYVRYKFIEQLPMALLQMFLFISIATTLIVTYYIYQDRFLYVVPLIGTFAFSVLKILPRVSSIGTSNMQMMDAYADLERTYYFLNDSRYNTIRNGTVTFDALTSDIAFEDVGFTYYEEQELIEGLNLTIHKNRVNALVGYSGSGKSTIISLLLRYYDVSSGRILINGIDLREYDLKTFLQKVGYVSQETFIYNATVRENIVFGGEYPEERIIEAAKKANIHTFIVGLPDGYDAIVGDQGLKLSGGEKQRLAIARALVRDPEILVLDEATSNLDNKSEAIVQDSINRVSEIITTFVVAHRLSTIRKADIIFVMNKGRVVESGSHDELMEKRGRYYDLYLAEG